MANGDPIRAKEIEDQATEEWWEKSKVYRRALSLHTKEQSNKWK